MRGPVSILLLLAAGFGLGLFFFGGLWLTVRASPASRHPTVLMLGSFWARTVLVVAGFVAAIASRWQNALACLLGFIIARVLLARWIPARGARGPG